MTGRAIRLLALALLFGLAASVASAQVYTVTLNNGTTFETRYEPRDAEFSEDVVILATDQGNWIALEKADIADVVSSVEATGFGYQLDTTTVIIGWSPNDLVSEDEDGNEVSEWGYLDDEVDSGANYTLEQFVNPPVVGTGLSTGGLPVQFVNQSPGGGGGGSGGGGVQ